MNDSARVLLDIAVLADVDGEKVRARKLREVSEWITKLEERLEIYSAPNDKGETVYLGVGNVDGIGCRDETIKFLDSRVKSLSEGECRFHCRVRADMWKTGVVYGRDHLQLTPEEAYKEWRKTHDENGF